MHTVVTNLVILEAEVVKGETASKIIGSAIEGNIKILFAVAETEVNRRLFVPEANLVVSGKFRIGREICTIGLWVNNIIAVVSLPMPVLPEIPTDVNRKQSVRSGGNKKSKATSKTVPVHA